MRLPFFRSKDRAPPIGVKSASFVFGMGGLRSMQHRYREFATEGYGQNPIVYACVDKISTAMSSVDFLLYEKTDGNLEKLEGDHDLTKLMERPNPTTSGRKFIDQLARFWLIGGSAFILGVGTDDKSVKPPKELYLLNPGSVRVVENKHGMFPIGYEYTQSDYTKIFYPVNQITGRSAILHIKTFNPIDAWNGLSPMVGAAQGIDVFNAGQQWNARLLQNEARPSGAMVVQGSDGKAATLTDEQYQRLKEQIEQNFSGAANAGRPMLLEGGLDWKQIGMNSRDMDHQNNMLMAARFTAGVYGVPPMLVNIPGDSTFANFEQARMALWTDTVLPKLSFLLDELNIWLVPGFGDNLQLWYDEEMVPALEPLRKEKADRLNESEYMTINEKRQAMGLDDVDGGDVILVPQTDIPLDLAGQMDLPEPDSPADNQDLPLEPKPKQPKPK